MARISARSQSPAWERGVRSSSFLSHCKLELEKQRFPSWSLGTSAKAKLVLGVPSGWSVGPQAAITACRVLPRMWMICPFGAIRFAIAPYELKLGNQNNFLAFVHICHDNQVMITWDESKRRSNLKNHGMDFMGCEAVFDNPVATEIDLREAYGEQRINLIGWLRGEVVHMTYCERGEALHVISLRRATRHESRSYFAEISR